MKLTTEQQQRILGVFQQRTQALFAGNCPLCRHKAWTVADGIINLSIGTGVTYPGYGPVFPDTIMPCVALVCGNCGHTELLNLFSLGLEDIAGYAPAQASGG